MLRRMVALLTVPILLAACASGGQQEQAAEPSAQATGGECNGRWEIQVRNRSRGDQSVDVYFMRSAVSNPERAGTVNPQDERSFYLISDSLWEVWASLGGQRILVRDHPMQQRYQVFVAVACDTR